MKKRDLQLDEYNISKYKYRELYNFCLQYEELKELLSRCYAISSYHSNGMPRNNKLPDPTADRAEKAIVYQKKIELIETTAKEAAGDLYPWLLQAVTNDSMAFDMLRLPCTMKYFRVVRRKFYFLLNERVSEIWPLMGHYPVV